MILKKWIQKIQNKLKEEYFHIEKRDDLISDEKVSQIIKHTASACTVVATQPLPFADSFSLLIFSLESPVTLVIKEISAFS